MAALVPPSNIFVPLVAFPGFMPISPTRHTEVTFLLLVERPRIITSLGLMAVLHALGTTLDSEHLATAARTM